MNAIKLYLMLLHEEKGFPGIGNPCASPPSLAGQKGGSYEFHKISMNRQLAWGSNPNSKTFQKCPKNYNI